MDKLHCDIVICTPSYDGKLCHETDVTLERTMASLTRTGLKVMRAREIGSSIAKNRNNGVTRALDHGAKWLFYLDSDMVIPHPGMIQRMMNHDVDIVGGLAFAKQVPFVPVISNRVDTVDIRKKQHRLGLILKKTIQNLSRIGSYLDILELRDEISFLANQGAMYKTILDYPENKLIEVDGTGGACLLIKTEIFKDIEPPYFCFDDFHGEVIGEDYYFCRKAKAAGFKIKVDTGIKLGHIGNYGFGEEDFRAYQKYQESVKTEKVA